MLECPRCQTENEDDARLCRECGGRLEPRSFAESAAPPTGEPSSAGAACPSCGRPAPAGAQFCDGCGSRLGASATGPTAASTTCPSCGRPAPAGAEFCAGCGKTLGVEYASFWRRFGGYLIDAVIVGVGTSIISLIISATISSALGPVIGFVFAIAYYVLLNANGGTLGKQALGMRLEHAETGEDIGIGRALARYVVAIASGLALGLGYLWSIWDDKKQTWHDKAANSVVVRR